MLQEDQQLETIVLRHQGDGVGDEMSDRELLEAAAKAAEIELRWHPDGTAFSDVRARGYWGVWNPLTDDGDALRLAVRLLFEIDMGRGCIAIRHSVGIKILEAFNHDPYAAIRRAIVRAAAEIAKSGVNSAQ